MNETLPCQQQKLTWVGVMSNVSFLLVMAALVVFGYLVFVVYGLFWLAIYMIVLAIAIIFVAYIMDYLSD